MQYLINLADQGIVHDVPDLRDRVQQLLNLIPSGKSLSSLPLFTVSGYYTLVNETNNGLQVNNQFSSNINLFFLPNFVFIYLVCVPSSAVVATDWMLAGMGASDQLWRNPIVVLAIHILSMFFFFFSDTETVGNIKNVCRACSENFSKTSSPSLDAMFFIPSSTQVLYNLEVRTLLVDVYGQVALLVCLFCDCTCILALSVCLQVLSVCPSVRRSFRLSVYLPASYYQRTEDICSVHRVRFF